MSPAGDVASLLEKTRSLAAELERDEDHVHIHERLVRSVVRPLETAHGRVAGRAAAAARTRAPLEERLVKLAEQATRRRLATG